MGNTAQHCRLGLFQDSDFVGDLEDSKSTTGGSLVYHWKPNTVSHINWMCKKQTSVSHGSTESEIISLDVGLRMDGLLALDLSDVVTTVLRSANNTKRTITQAPRNWYWTGNHSSDKTMTKYQLKRVIEMLIHCYMWTKYPTQAHSSQGESQLNIFKNNEVVIKRDTRREPRELRLIGCSIELILEPKIQIKYVDTKNPLADMLTQESFSRDEWNHLLR